MSHEIWLRPVLVEKQTGADMNSYSWPVQNWRYSGLKLGLKICAALLGLFAGAFISHGASPRADAASRELMKADSQQKSISVFGIKGRPADFTGKRLAAALFQKLTLDEILLVKNPLARFQPLSQNVPKLLCARLAWSHFAIA